MKGLPQIEFGKLIAFIFLGTLSLQLKAQANESPHLIYNECGVEPMSTKDIVFLDFDLFEFKPICPVEKSIDVDYYLDSVSISAALIEFNRVFLDDKPQRRSLKRFGNLWVSIKEAKTSSKSKGFDYKTFYVFHPRCILKLRYAGDWFLPNSYLLNSASVALPDGTIWSAPTIKKSEYLIGELPSLRRLSPIIKQRYMIEREAIMLETVNVRGNYHQGVSKEKVGEIGKKQRFSLFWRWF